MAVLGMTQLEAVNEILRGVGILPVSAVDTGGSSDAAEAERVLEYCSELEQTKGWKSNTAIAKEYTSAATPFAITAGTNILRVECVAPGRYRDNIALGGGATGDEFYIVTEDTTSFGAEGVKIYCNVVLKRTFVTCSPDLKHVIVTEATKIMRRRKKFDPNLDQALSEEALEADVRADRNIDAMPPPSNAQPVNVGAPRGGDRPR